MKSFHQGVLTLCRVGVIKMLCAQLKTPCTFEGSRIIAREKGQNSDGFSDKVIVMLMFRLSMHKSNSLHDVQQTAWRFTNDPLLV